MSCDHFCRGTAVTSFFDINITSSVSKEKHLGIMTLQAFELFKTYSQKILSVVQTNLFLSNIIIYENKIMSNVK